MFRLDKPRLERLAVTIASVACFGLAADATATPCPGLTSLSLPNATITSAQVVAAGTFVPPERSPDAAASAAFKTLPAFCRVAATVRRPDGSDVKIEVWMPAARWNGEFQPSGSGFWGGSIVYSGGLDGGMAHALQRGAATAASNLGHDGGGGPAFAAGHPEKLADLGNVPFHLMVERARAIIKAYYGRSPNITLMDECGGGGSRDALAEVQRWPADLDAVNAVGFTNWGTHHGIAQMWVYQATHKTPESAIPSSKLPLIHQAALDACDARDGVKDGVIEDPPRCRFDPGVLLCRNVDAPNCLTAPQVDAVRTIYATPVHTRTKAFLYGSMPPGGELGWEEMIGPVPYPYAVPFYKNLVFKDPNWDYRTRPVNFDTDVDLADAPENAVINATNPDIRPYIARGGKLLLMGGWNDHTLGPGNNVHYYESVVAAVGSRAAQDSVRLFMVPGMDHCLGNGYGPNATYPTVYSVDFDAVAFLKQWKATGKAPDRIVVTTTGKQQRKRLVCAYPRVSIYKGPGDANDPGSFACEMPAQ
jgi:feruloyl esterase